jgi:rubrerythrin
MEKRVVELLQQMHETEKGGVQIYETALECVVNDDLKREWTEYLDQTRRHERIMRDMFGKLGLEPEDTPGRRVVRHLGGSLVAAMRMAKDAGDAEAAEIVASECVTLAETKDHLNWQLLSQCAQEANGKEAEILAKACGEVEDEEDEHIYHSRGWCRELWISALGMEAVLPPPEEQKDVKSETAAARAYKSRDKML